jgi:hypothetical protein
MLLNVHHVDAHHLVALVLSAQKYVLREVMSQVVA